MQLISIYLENFRAYKAPVRIYLDDFTAFIGRNDVGKSTILEAMEVFFNSQIVKVDRDDLSVDGEQTYLAIGCEFVNFPSEIVLDASASTTLSAEYLLNSRGNLEICKEYDFSGTKVKESIFAIANHPTNEKLNDLLSLKNKPLKDRAKELEIDLDGVNLSSNPPIRNALWKSAELQFEERKIPLNDEDAKKIWSKLMEYMPIFALFQADRPSRDDDAEVQDPMKLAMIEAVKAVETELDKIRDQVKQKVVEVAERTLEKLRELDPALAGQLIPSFKAEPKWEGFKLTLAGENGIPINKRGSGVRRLILLSFFRAEAERKREMEEAPSIIYAVEEPESSQHPDNQRMIAQALLELSELSGCQVLITTHVPGLANLLPVESLRHIYRSTNGTNLIRSGEDEGVARAIADTLGALPDNRVKVIVYVEGPNDIAFLKAVSRLYAEEEQGLIDVGSDTRVALLPIGGSNLMQWVAEDYLKDLDYPQVHIYDRGTSTPPRFQKAHDEVNEKDNQKCYLTERNEMENYISVEAINRCLNVQLSTMGPNDDVPLIVAKAIHDHDPSPGKQDWADILTKENSQKCLDMKMKKAKKQLNFRVASEMSISELLQSDSEGEIKRWLKCITDAAINGRVVKEQ